MHVQNAVWKWQQEKEKLQYFGKMAEWQPPVRIIIAIIIEYHADIADYE